MTSDQTPSPAPCAGLRREAEEPRREGSATAPQPDPASAPASAVEDAVADSAAGDTPSDAAQMDHASLHAGPADAGSGDTIPPDADAGDAGSGSAVSADTGSGDISPRDADSGDAGSGNAASADAGSGDAGSEDATAASKGADVAPGDADVTAGDAGSGDVVSVDAGSGDASPRDAGSGDASPRDAVSEDTASADAGPGGTGSADATAASKHEDVAPGDADLTAGDADAAPADPDAGVADTAAAPASTPAEPDEEALRLAEAMIFASASPVSARALSQLLPDTADADAVIAALRARYAGRGVQLVDTAGGVQFRTAPELAPRLRKVIEVPRKLPRVAMETLAIIAYHQPCTRAEVEEIRGTSLSQQTLDALLEANLVAPKGRREVPGRPTLWGTTPQFLLQFGLRDIRDLPQRTDLLLEPPQPSGVSDAPPLSSDLSAPQPGLDHRSGESSTSAASAAPADSAAPTDGAAPGDGADPGDSPAPGESPGAPGEPNPAPGQDQDGAPLSRG
jgi:segregation and condensation protein B